MPGSQPPPRPARHTAPPPRRPTSSAPRLRPSLFRRPSSLFTRVACRGGLLWQRRPSRCPVAMPLGRGGGGGGGGGRQAPAASAPLASTSYYERVGQLQQALRERYGRGTGRGVSCAAETFGYPVWRSFPFPAKGSPGPGPACDPPLAPDGVRSTKFNTNDPMFELGTERETRISHGN